MKNKLIIPPWIPEVRSITDTQYFEEYDNNPIIAETPTEEN